MSIRNLTLRIPILVVLVATSVLGCNRQSLQPKDVGQKSLDHGLSLTKLDGSVFDVRVGGALFHIPRANVASATTAFEKRIQLGHADYVVLHAYLPDLLTDPRERVRAGQTAYDDLVEIQLTPLSPHQLNGERSAGERTLLASEFEIVGDERRIGLIRYESKRPHIRESESRFVPADSGYRTPSGNPLVIVCHSARNNEALQFTECQADYVIPDLVGLRYQFRGWRIADWMVIDSGVRQLIQKFREGSK